MRPSPRIRTRLTQHGRFSTRLKTPTAVSSMSPISRRSLLLRSGTTSPFFLSAMIRCSKSTSAARPAITTPRHALTPVRRPRYASCVRRSRSTTGEFFFICPLLLVRVQSSLLLNMKTAQPLSLASISSVMPPLVLLQQENATGLRLFQSSRQWQIRPVFRRFKMRWSAFSGARS